MLNIEVWLDALNIKFQFGERKTKGVKKGGIIRWERTQTISSKEIIGVYRNIVVNRHATHV